MLWLKRAAFISLLLASTVGSADDSFVIKSIAIKGLQHIDQPTVLHYLPVKVGQVLKPEQTAQIIKALYKTGFFADINLAKEGSRLIITVTEHPVIGSITIVGNKAIATKQLTEVLKKLGLTEGNIYNPSNLAAIKFSLEEQYTNLSHYDADITLAIKQESRHRVAITINIKEGVTAKISTMHIIGNNAFSEKRLFKVFKLSISGIFSFITSNDKYSKEKLDEDLESLRSFYMDRGYLKFRIDSTQASITPDKKHVYIVIKITEGPVYRIKDMKLTGNLIGEEKEINRLITVKSGAIFSRKDIIEINNNISHFLADRGYAFASVNIEPTFIDQTHEVLLNFVVQPGNLTYVQHVNFTGNTITQEKVLRREVRQAEGGLFSLSQVEESARRLANLGYLEVSPPETTPVPGKPSQVDITYPVKETSSARANFQLGYSDLYKFLYGISLDQSNFLGTGKTVGIGLTHSAYMRNYYFNYIDPYYTPYGVSRAIGLYSQTVTPGSVNISPYTTNIYGANVVYGIPLSDYSSWSIGYGYEYNKINSTASSSKQVNDFLAQYGNSFNIFKLTGGWGRGTYDRAVFPRSGTAQKLSTELGLPFGGTSLDYYTLTYKAAWYKPLGKYFIFHADGTLGYGNGYGKFHALPFFKNYFAGGIGSVRGYDSNTLGPIDSNNDAIGGNVLTTASAALIFPNNISERLRTSVFVDGGNVFQNSISLGQLRYSAGLAVEWSSPIGPLAFSFAKALNSKSNDEIRSFQFSIGTSF